LRTILFDASLDVQAAQAAGSNGIRERGPRLTMVAAGVGILRARGAKLIPRLIRSKQALDRQAFPRGGLDSGRALEYGFGLTL